MSKTIYIDSDFHCHITNDGIMAAVETDYFDGKCDSFVEGYRYVPEGHSWTREDGATFHGPMIAPHTDYRALDSAQRDYEKQKLAEAEEALNIIFTGGTT